MSKNIITTQNLCRNFGALPAVDNVSLEFQRGETHAIIGPNGAGKTTFINLLSGDLHPNGGAIYFNGRDITQQPPERIAQSGIGRSYQKSNIFPQFTCMENCWIGAQARQPSSMRFLRPAGRQTMVEQRALEALERCGLGTRRHVVANTLSYGEQRQLEIATVLATQPELLLLDEPLAGMGSDESQRSIELLNELAQHKTLILIEHDMDAVFSIAQCITVMVNGSVLESGEPERIRHSKLVQQAYLGEGVQT